MKVNLSDINSVYKIDKNLNFNDLLKERDDIISIDKCLVTGSLEETYGEVTLNLEVNVEMVLASSRSFKPIPYKLNFNLELLFSDSEKADFSLEKTIYIKEIVFGHILLEKPLSIYDEDETPYEKPREKNPAFSALEDFKI